MTNKKIYILMVFCTVFWAGAFIAGKYTVPYIPTFTLTFLRFFFATIILYFVMKRMKAPFKLEKSHAPIFLFTGTVGMFGYHVLFFSAIKYTTAINSSIISATSPIITVLLAFIFLKNKLTIKQSAGVVISFIGVVLTITGASIDVITSFSINIGDILMLAAVFSWASYGIFSKMKGEGIPSIILTYYSFLVCTIILIPFMIYERPWTFLLYIPIKVYIAVLYMSVFPSVIGYLVQQMAIKQIGPSKATNFVNLVPVFSIILAVIILGETLEPIKLLTAGMIIAGVLICQRN